MRGSLWLLLVAVLAALAAAGVALGAAPLSLGVVWNALVGEGEQATVAIVRSLRVPRVALAMLVGAALGMSGGALQGSLRNALAEPYLLGVSGGAAVGAVMAIALGVTSVAAVPLAAFAGAAAAG